MRVVTIAGIGAAIGGFAGASGSSSFSIPVALLSGFGVLGFFFVLMHITPQSFYEVNSQAAPKDSPPLAIKNILREMSEKLVGQEEKKKRESLENAAGIEKRLEYEYRYFLEILQIVTYRVFILANMTAANAGEYAENNDDAQNYILGLYESVLDFYFVLTETLDTGHKRNKALDMVKLFGLSYKDTFGEASGECLSENSSFIESSDFFFKMGYEDGVDYLTKSIEPIGFKKIVES